MLPLEYKTICLGAGKTITFRLRDLATNRFEIIRTALIDDLICGIDIDDCDGEQFATVVRILSAHVDGQIERQIKNKQNQNDRIMWQNIH